jgi:hypothetical protein
MTLNDTLMTRKKFENLLSFKLDRVEVYCVQPADLIEVDR